MACRTASALDISIHAPREGSDLRHPDELVQPDSISIHAPREGSDGLQRDIFDARLAFQSTLPARGATAKMSKL